MMRIPGALVALSGAIAMVASFLPWLEVYGRNRPTRYHLSLDGVEVHALTGFGDGYLLVVLGTVVVMTGVLAVVVPSRQPILGLLISLTGILIAGVALYDALQIRPGSKYWPKVILGGEIYDVDAGIALWLTLALGIIIAIGGVAILWLSTAGWRSPQDSPFVRLTEGIS